MQPCFLRNKGNLEHRCAIHAEGESVLKVLSGLEQHSATAAQEEDQQHRMALFLQSLFFP